MRLLRGAGFCCWVLLFSFFRPIPADSDVLSSFSFFRAVSSGFGGASPLGKLATGRRCPDPRCEFLALVLH